MVTVLGLFPGFTEIPAETPNFAWAKWSVVLPYMKRPLNSPWSVYSWDDVLTLNEMVNGYVRYRPDPDDRWQTPQDTFLCREGDCEDFAILKWKLLSDDLPTARFGMALGTILGIDHAFLVMRFEEKVRVLDNRFDQLIEPSAYYNLEPKMLICGDGIFRYAKSFSIADVLKKDPRG